MGTISQVHNKIQDVVGAQSAGASLVTFNNEAFCSYGKSQSLNSPISESSMFKYTTALKYLLAGQSNRIRIADTTVVFWAETGDKSCEDLVRFFFDPQEAEKIEDQNAEGSRVRDTATIKQIGDILTKVRSGTKIHQEDIGTDAGDEFQYPWPVSEQCPACRPLPVCRSSCSIIPMAPSAYGPNG